MNNLSKICLYFLITAVFFTSCSKEKDTAPGFMQNYSAELRGVHAVPTNSSSATALFNGTYNSSTQTLTYTLSYADMTPTSWAIHVGAAGTVGAIVFPLGPITASPKSGSIKLNASQFSNLSAGLYYVNIVSPGFTEGEVRGQIIKL